MSILKDICAVGGAVTILAAIISGVGGILGGISGQWYTYYHTEGSAFPNIEIVFAESISTYGSQLHDDAGHYAYPPYIDIILFNRGKSVGIINRIDLEIISAFLNMTPVISYCNFNKEDWFYNNTIQAKIINEGWGPAKELEWKSNINFGEFNKQLKLFNNQFNWTGDVDAGETLVLNFICHPEDGYFVSFSDNNEIQYNRKIYKQIYKGKIDTKIKYKNINKSKSEVLDYFEDEIYLYKIDRSTDISSFTRTDLPSYIICSENNIASIINPLEIFYIDSIDPEMNCPSTMSFGVHHYLNENQVDRIVLKINSTEKSGKIEYRIKVIYNSETPTISKVRNMEWINTNFNYFKNIKNINIIV